MKQKKTIILIIGIISLLFCIGGYQQYYSQKATNKAINGQNETIYINNLAHQLELEKMIQNNTLACNRMSTQGFVSASGGSVDELGSVGGGCSAILKKAQSKSQSQSTFNNYRQYYSNLVQNGQGCPPDPASLQYDETTQLKLYTVKDIDGKKRRTTEEMGTSSSEKDAISIPIYYYSEYGTNGTIIKSIQLAGNYEGYMDNRGANAEYQSLPSTKIAHLAWLQVCGGSNVTNQGASKANVTQRMRLVPTYGSTNNQQSNGFTNPTNSDQNNQYINKPMPSPSELSLENNGRIDENNKGNIPMIGKEDLNTIGGLDEKIKIAFDEYKRQFPESDITKEEFFERFTNAILARYNNSTNLINEKQKSENNVNFGLEVESNKTLPTNNTLDSYELFQEKSESSKPVGTRSLRF